jgi:alpha-tubulin suppressor-like RCC1 family protein
VKTDGTLWCWGENLFGQIGDGTTTGRLAPVQVVALANSVAQVTVGNSHTCARKIDSTVWCWGNNSMGNLGDGTLTERHTPVQVTALTGVTDVERSVAQQRRRERSI